jgi:hypothetical protein
MYSCKDVANGFGSALPNIYTALVLHEVAGRMLMIIGSLGVFACRKFGLLWRKIETMLGPEIGLSELMEEQR